MPYLIDILLTFPNEKLDRTEIRIPFLVEESLHYWPACDKQCDVFSAHKFSNPLRAFRVYPLLVLLTIFC